MAARPMGCVDTLSRGWCLIVKMSLEAEPACTSISPAALIHTLPVPAFQRFVLSAQSLGPLDVGIHRNYIEESSREQSHLTRPHSFLKMSLGRKSGNNATFCHLLQFPVGWEGG